ncbi:MAG: hypothetical protein ACREAC_27520 [Blastocatellia bacterium]
MLGWVATAIFAASYFFKQPAMLRRIQSGAACLWICYGAAIGSAPVVVANLIVAAAAVYSSFRRQSSSGGEGPRMNSAPEGIGIIHVFEEQEL